MKSIVLLKYPKESDVQIRKASMCRILLKIATDQYTKFLEGPKQEFSG